jgi:hypothetical protein
MAALDRLHDPRSLTSLAIPSNLREILLLEAICVRTAKIAEQAGLATLAATYRNKLDAIAMARAGRPVTKHEELCSQGIVLGEHGFVDYSYDLRGAQTGHFPEEAVPEKYDKGNDEEDEEDEEEEEVYEDEDNSSETEDDSFEDVCY